VNDKSPCNTKFNECSGFEFPECPTCVQPAKEDVGFVPGLTTGASIGVVVGASIGGLLLLGVLVYFASVRDSRVEFKPSVHSMHEFPGTPDGMQKAGSFSGGSPNMSRMNLYNEKDGMPAYASQAPVAPFNPIMNEI